MSILKFRCTEFDTAVDNLKTVNERFDDAITRTTAANKVFQYTNQGVWAEAESEACISVETQSRVFREAMDSFQSKFENIRDSGKDIQSKRDAFVAAMGAAPEDEDLVMCNSDSSISSMCDAVDSDIDTLKSKGHAAQNAMDGLRDSGPIYDAVQALLKDLFNEGVKVGIVRDKWEDLKDATDTFERTYSDEGNAGSITASQFVTSAMIDAAEEDLASSYDADFFGAVGIIDTATGEIKKGVKDWGKSCELIGKVFTEAKAFSFNKGKWGEKFFEKLSELNPKIKLNSGLGLMDDGAKSMSQGLDAMDDLASSTDDFVDGAEKFTTGYGNVFKGAGKVLGVVGDGLSLLDTFQKSKKAYYSTAGDTAQKTAAAVVTAGEGLTKFGVGKAIGLVTGTFLGGPVGAVAGMAIGAAVDKGMDWLIGKFQDSGAEQKCIDGLGQFFRGGKKKASIFQFG